MRYAFQSRRSALEPSQLEEFRQLKYGPIDGRPMTLVETAPVEWAATNNFVADVRKNAETWIALFNAVGEDGVVLGDFPHAALEALHRVKANASGPIELPSVYVRIYAIGGGFKRDTEYQRWAKIG